MYIYVYIGDTSPLFSYKIVSFRFQMLALAGSLFWLELSGDDKMGDVVS